MDLKSPSFMTPSFFGVSKPEQFWSGIESIADSLAAQRGLFASDNLIAFERSLGFMTDKALVSAYKTHAETLGEQGALWRLAVLAWAARTAFRFDGDFVECGCYKGTSARIIMDILDFRSSKKKYFLYDLFEHNLEMPHHAMPEHGEGLYEQVLNRFSNLDNVTIIRGQVPESLSVSPEKISFLHLDLNNAIAEIGALNILFNKMAPGGIIILDDFGWLAYEDQRVSETSWFIEKGRHVLELPTGQGLVIC